MKTELEIRKELGELFPNESNEARVSEWLALMKDELLVAADNRMRKWRIEAERNRRSPHEDVKKNQTLQCPKCHSDEWKSLSFLYQAGISVLNAKTSATGGGVGIGTGGVGVGVGGSTGKTTGALQSGLSTQAAPPAKPSKMPAGVIYWGLVILLLMGLGEKNAVIAAIVLFGAIYKWGDFSARWKTQELEDAKNYEINRARWERSRMCQRCGEIYDPESAESST